MAQLRSLIIRALTLLGVAAIAMGWPGGQVRTTAAESPWVLVPNGMPLFHFDGIAPGDSGSATFTVTNPEASPATFNFAVASLENDDNGCNEPEQAEGDTTCGPGGGELQFDLRIGLIATGASDRTVATRTLAEWPALAVADPVALAGNETRTYRVGYDLPIGSSNMTQSDMVAFVFRLHLDLVGAGVGVGAAHRGRAGHPVAPADRHRCAAHRGRRTVDRLRRARPVPVECEAEAIHVKMLAAVMLAGISAFATTGVTSAPLLDVERSDISSIVGATESTVPQAIVRQPARPVEPVVDTPVVDTTVVDTSVVDTSVVDTTVVDTTVVDTPVVDTTVVDTSVVAGG